MKCTPVRLINRSEYNKSKWKHIHNFHHRNIDPVYITKEYHGYSFTFLRSRSPTPIERPGLTVKNLQLPENFSTYNTGYSLDKWSKKIPRLKSGNKSASTRISSEIDQDCDIIVDVHNILHCLEHSEVLEDADIFNDTGYDDHSDIEELLRKSHEIRQEAEEERVQEKRKGIRNKKKTGEGRRSKHRLKKTIRFSFSKPASPNTEQIIRVDVTSNISVEEMKHSILEKGDIRGDDCNKGLRKMINESKESGKKSHGGFGENDVIKFDEDSEDFVIRCSQLALTQRRR